MQCVRCQGLLNWQWNVELRREELHCLLCGYLPEIRLVRADGHELTAPRQCVICNLRPRVKIGQVGKVGYREIECCAGCREMLNRRARMNARWKQALAGKL